MTSGAAPSYGPASLQPAEGGFGVLDGWDRHSVFVGPKKGSLPGSKHVIRQGCDGVKSTGLKARGFVAWGEAPGQI